MVRRYFEPEVRREAPQWRAYYRSPEYRNGQGIDVPGGTFTAGEFNKSTEQLLVYQEAHAPPGGNRCGVDGPYPGCAVGKAPPHDPGFGKDMLGLAKLGLTAATWVAPLAIPVGGEEIDAARAADVVATAADDGETSLRTVGELRAAGETDAHHIIQDAAVRDVAGYKATDAPGVRLRGPSTKVGSPHYEATQVQRAANVGGTYGAERQVACMALAAAGCSPTMIADALARADDYFMRELGLTLDSPLRVPGNRTMP